MATYAVAFLSCSMATLGKKPGSSMATYAVAFMSRLAPVTSGHDIVFNRKTGKCFHCAIANDWCNLGMAALLSYYT